MIEFLEQRMKDLENVIEKGQIPGVIDSIELKILEGRIWELQFISSMLSASGCTCDPFGGKEVF